MTGTYGADSAASRGWLATAPTRVNGVTERPLQSHAFKSRSSASYRPRATATTGAVARLARPRGIERKVQLWLHLPIVPKSVLR